MRTNKTNDPPHIFEKEEDREDPGQFAFRLPSDLDSYWQAAELEGVSKTEFAVQSIRMARDIEKVLGAGLARVKRLAATKEMSLGEALGMLADDGLGRAK